MSKLHAQDESVSLRLLNHDDLEGSTLLDGENGDQWASRDASKPFLAPSRISSPESTLSWLSKRRVLVRAFCGISLLTFAAVILVLSRKPIAAHISNWRTPTLKPELPLPSVHDLSLYVATEHSPRFRGMLPECS
jgi:hypothetical protein